MKKRLFQSPDISATLCYYQSNHSMGDHAHDYHQISFLLGGELCETNRQQDREVLRPSLGLKPAGLTHSDQYGPYGSLILSINIDHQYDPQALGFGFTDWSWTGGIVSQKLAVVKHTLKNLLSAGFTDQETAVWDLISLCDESDIRFPVKPPHWLKRVRERLRDEPDSSISDIARDEGVHAVYLSRVFSKVYGCAPSVFRSNYRFTRAFNALVDGASITDAALSAGYSDHAHFTRQAKKEVGLTPKALSGVFAVA